MALDIPSHRRAFYDTAAAERQAERDAERKADALRRRQRATAADDPWWPIAESEIPDRVRFDITRASAGHIVQVAYGTFGRAEACANDPYMMVYDRSLSDAEEGPRYYRRRPV